MWSYLLFHHHHLYVNPKYEHRLNPLNRRLVFLLPETNATCYSRLYQLSHIYNLVGTEIGFQ